MQLLKKLSLLSLLLCNLNTVVFTSFEEKNIELNQSSQYSREETQERARLLAGISNFQGNPDLMSTENLRFIFKTSQRSNRANSSSVARPSVGAELQVNQSESTCCLKVGACCCLLLCIPAATIPGVLLTKSTCVVNKTNQDIVIKRRYSATSKTREEMIRPGDEAYYPHNTWDTFCIQADPYGAYDKNCLSQDERDGGTGGCDALEVRVKISESSGEPKLVKKQCKEKQRRLIGAYSGLNFDKVMNKEDQKKYSLYAQNFNFTK